MPRKQKQVTASELIQSVAAGLRTSANRPNIYGYKPHPKQQKFHQSEAKGRQFIGGNRSGKTVGGACEMVWWLRGQHPFRPTPEPPVRARCVSVDFDNGVEKIVKPEISRWLPPSALKNGSWEDSYDKQLRVLTLDNGSFLEFMSYVQDIEKFAGTSRHCCWYDEEPPREVYVECSMRLIDTGGHWWMTMTPVEGMTWTYDEIYLPARTDPNLFVIEVAMLENPHINQGEIESYMAGLDEDEKKARLQGKYVQIGGLIFKQFSEKNIIDPFIPPKNWLHFCMMDHGYNNPTCFLWGAVDRDGRIFIYDEHYESGELVQYHAEKVKQRNRLLGREPDYYVGDPSIRNTDPITGTTIQTEYIEHGVPIALGNNDVATGINRVGEYLKGIADIPRLYITHNCINLIHEIQRYRWSPWASKKLQEQRDPKEKPHKKGDHAVDALRYGIMSRPVLDDSSYRPSSLGNFLGVPVASSPEQDILASVPAVQEGTQDYHMGSEF